MKSIPPYYSPAAQIIIQEREARLFVERARQKIIADALVAGKRIIEIHDEIIIEE